MEILNVTKLEPRLKHPTIFKYFDALEPGESFIIRNDHDPKPLYYQLLGERGNIFNWEYLEQGPDSWQIRIAKKNMAEKAVTVGAVAASDYRKAAVFKKWGIDFCCGGNKSLKEAAAEAGIAADKLQNELEQANAATILPSQDYNKWELDFLADYIMRTHHRYIKENAPVIKELAAKVADRHKTAHPELPELSENIQRFLDELLTHAMKEEKVLFPNIKKLVFKKNNPGNDIMIPASLIQQAIKIMETEHAHSGEELKQFRKLTNNYALPKDACNSYNYLFEKLKEFESDLLQHIHLENNILFPGAVELENKIAK